MNRLSTKIFGAAFFLLIISCACACSRRPAGAVVYVTNEKDGTVSVIDAKTDKVVDTLFVGGRPRGIRTSGDGSRLYVARSAPLNKKPTKDDNKIVVLDTNGRKIIDFLDIGDDPEQLDLTGEQTFLYASNEDNGTATVIDLKTRQPMATLIVGIEPEGVKISPDGHWVYVMAETSNTVTVIDTQKQAVVNTFMVGARPRDAAFSPDGSKAYITAEVGQNLTVVDTATQKVIQTVPLGFNENVKLVGIVVSLDGQRIYIANGRANLVSVLDANNFQTLATIAVGSRVWGLAMTPDGKKIYAANGLSNNVSVIDTATNKVTATIAVGNAPWGVAVADFK